MPCLLDTGGGINLLGQIALRHAPPDLHIEKLPHTFHVHGANGQEVFLSGTIDVCVEFEARGQRFPVKVRCAMAPEFKGGILLSKKTMAQIGINIELRRPRCLIRFRRWRVMIEEATPSLKAEAASVSQLRATEDNPSHRFKKDSQLSQLLQQIPAIVPVEKADNFLRDWRSKPQPTPRLVVFPLAERKLFWNVLRDLLVAVPRLVDAIQIEPQVGPCLLGWIGSERKARKFRVALANQTASTGMRSLIDQMVEFAKEPGLRDRAERLLKELIAFGTMDALPVTTFTEGGERDPEDNRDVIYLPKSKKPESIDLKQRLEKVKIGALSKEALTKVKLLLQEFKVIFRDPTPGTVPRTKVEHLINFRREAYAFARAYRLGAEQSAALRAHVQDLLALGMVRPSSSPYASAIFPIPKKDEKGRTVETRWVIDYRAINDLTVPDRYPLPVIEELLPKVSRARVFSKIDLKSSYWQVLMKKEDVAKTAFITDFGLYECVTMPFGLRNAPATFQRLMDRVLDGCTFAVGYIDDILLYSDSFASHLCHLREVFDRLRRFGLCVNPGKCTLAVKELLFLGYMISHGRIRADQNKIEAVQRYTRPKTVREVQKFLGFVGFYRKFIRGFSMVASPLSELSKKGVPFKWGPKQQHAFDTLRERLTKAPILALPDKDRTFILETDASIKGIGCVLSQEFPEGKLPVAFASRTLSLAESRYATRELEALAILWSCKRFSSLVQGKPFVVLTDHASLEWLRSWKNPSPRVRRWIQQLEEFDFESRYQPGRHNKVADALSRMVAPIQVAVEPPMTELLDFPSDASWKEAYAEDPIYGPFLQFLKEPARFGAVDRVKFERWTGRLTECDALLYIQRPGSVDPRGLLVVPEIFRPLFLAAYHDLPTAGHMGRDKMYGVMSRRFYWPTLKTDIVQYIRGCLACALMRTRKPPKTALGLFDDVVTRPFEIIHVDHVTNLPATSRGYDAILVIADRCTGWIEVKAVKSLSAVETAEGILEMVVYRHGVPGAIVSDQGGAFTALVIAELASRCGFQQRFTTAYNPMSNGFVERRNGMIKKMLRSFCAAEPSTWVVYLGAVQFAIRTAPWDKTGMTPAFLLYGRELVTPVEALLSSRVEAPLRDVTQWTISRIRIMKQARELVAAQLQQAREERVAQEQERFGEVEIVVGDYVCFITQMPEVRNYRSYSPTSLVLI